VSDVAKEAGVADGTIYLYFKSKDDLLISLFERRMQQVNDTLRAAIEGVKSPRQQLRAFVQAYLQLVHDEPSAAEVLTIELRQSSKFMKEYENPEFADFLRLLGGIIAAAQDKGEIDGSIPAHVAARMIFGMLDELALAWVLAKQPLPAASGARPKKFDIVRAADWVITLVTRGLERGVE
jgi:TetR/AcrR family fatty acid metabolism transcriptional regulator